MAAAKSERILNLLIALLTTKRYLTKSELAELVEGYRDVKSFDRTFERDKAELRELGVTIETGSNDADDESEDGYRIDRRTFELPEVEFTGEELVAIGLAAHAWQTSVGAQATATALQRLRAAGAEPDLDRLPNVRAHIPVAEPQFDPIYAALHARQTIRFTYDGRARTLQPWRLHQRKGLWLVHGFDVDRAAPRRFKLSRIDGEVASVGAPGAYEIPTDLDAHEAPTTQATAIVAWRGTPPQSATPVDWPEPLPDGFHAVELAGFSEEMIVTEILAAGDDAIALAPDDVRSAVVAGLTRWAEVGR